MINELDDDEEESYNSEAIEKKLEIVDDELDFKRPTAQGGNNKFFRLPPSDDEEQDVEEDVDDFINKINKKKQEMQVESQDKESDDGQEDSSDDFDFKMTNMRKASTKAAAGKDV